MDPNLINPASPSAPTPATGVAPVIADVAVKTAQAPPVITPTPNDAGADQFRNAFSINPAPRPTPGFITPEPPRPPQPAVISPAASLETTATSTVAAPPAALPLVPAEPTPPTPAASPLEKAFEVAASQAPRYKKPMSLFGQVKIGITAMVFIGATLGAATLFNRLQTPEQTALNSSIAGGLPEQDLSVEVIQAAPSSLQFSSDALVVNGDLVSTGALKLYSGEYFANIVQGTVSSDRTYTLPDIDGTFCLDSNNCGYVTPDQLTTALGGFQPTTTSGATAQTLTAGSGVTINGDTISNSGVLSLNNNTGAITLTGGSGVSVSGLTISNTGVTSLGGQTGALSLVSGPGISISGLTVSNNGVTSIQGLTGNVTFTAGAGIDLTGTAISNSGVTSITGTSSQITASASTGGITLSLPQNITTTSTPTFGGMTLTGALNATTITPGSALTVGSTSQTALLQGSNTSVTATSGASTTTLTFQTPTAHVTYRLATAAAGSYDLCTTAGNCVGVGGSVSTAGGTAGTIAKFTSANGIGDSIIEDDGTTVTVNGDFAVTGVINGQILSDDAHFTGNVQIDLDLTVDGSLTVDTIDSVGALTVGSTGNDLLLQGSAVTLSSTDSGITNSLVFATPSGSNKIITLPNASGTVCLTTGNCAGVGGTGDVLQNGNSFGSTMTIGTNDAHSLALETDGVARLTINTNGRVSIGSGLTIQDTGGNVDINSTSPYFRINAANNGQIILGQGGGSVDVVNSLVVQGSGNSSFVGNLGIGISSPSTKLDVRAASTASQVHISSDSTDGGGYIQTGDISQISLTGGGTWNGSANIAKAAESSRINLTSGNIFFYTNTGLTAGNSYSPTQRFMMEAATGNVSIGSTSPSAKLHIQGGNTLIDNAQAYQINNNAATAINALSMDSSNHLSVGATSGMGNLNLRAGTGSISMVTSSGTAITVLNGGNVGIGSAATNPIYKLDVQGTSGTVGIRSHSTTAGDILFYGTGTVTGSIDFFRGAVSATGAVQGNIVNVNTASSTANAVLDINVGGASAGDPYLQFTVSTQQTWLAGIDNSDSDKFKISSGPLGGGSGGSNDRLTIDTSGNVGIGTNAPGTKLHVVDGSGSLKFQNVSQENLLVTGVNATVRVDAIGSGFPGYDFYVGGSRKAQVGWDDSVSLLNVFSSGAITLGAGAVGGAGDLTVSSGGNVGIGSAATSPGNLLVLSQTSASPTLEFANNSSGGSGILFTHSGSTKGFIGESGQNSALIVGDTLGDIGIRSQNQRINLSADAGSTIQASLNSSGNFSIGMGNVAPGARLQVNGAASGIGLIVKNNATTPGNLQEWQNSSSTALALVNSTGGFEIGNASTTTLPLKVTRNGGSVLAEFYNAATRVAYIGDLGDYVTYNNGFQLGQYIYNGADSQSAKIALKTQSAGTIGLAIMGHSGQTADLLQVKDSSGTPLAKVASNGALSAASLTATGLEGTVLTLGGPAAGGGTTGIIDVVVPGSGSGTVGHGQGVTGGARGRALRLQAGASDNSINGVGGDLILRPGIASSPATEYGNVVIADQGGRVGIGVTVPTATLQVAGNVLFKNTANTTTAFQIQNAAGSVLAVADTTNNSLSVGVASGQKSITVFTGEAATTPVTITTSTDVDSTGYSSQKKLATLSTGRHVAVFADTTTNAQFRYSDDGNTWTNYSADIAGWVNGSISSYVDSGGTERLVAVWRQSGTGGGRTNNFPYIMVGSFNTTRTTLTWGTAVVISGDASGDDLPDVVANAEGSGGYAHVVWSYTNDGRTLYDPFSIAGNTPSAGSRLSLTSSQGVSYGSYPSIDMDPVTKRIFVAWSLNTTGTGKGIRFRTASYSGGSWTWASEVEVDASRYVDGEYRGVITRWDGTRVVIGGWLVEVARDFVTYESTNFTSFTTRLHLDDIASGNGAMHSPSMAINPANGDIYMFGNDNAGDFSLAYRKWTRATNTLSARTIVDSGAAASKTSVYVSAMYASGKIHWIYTAGTNSPYNIKYGTISFTAPTSGLDTTSKLVVNGNLEASSITINGIALGSSSSSYWLQTGNTIYYSLGSVGIGTGTPTARLHVSSAEAGVALFKVTDATGSGLDAFTVADGGNVGIGTVSPNALLHVKGSNPAIRLDRNANTQTVALALDSAGTEAGYLGLSRNDAGGFFSNGTANSVVVYSVADIQLGSGTSAHLTVKAGGDVGIGTSSPGGVGSGGGSKVLQVHNASGASVAVLSTANTANTNYAGAFEFATTGASSGEKRSGGIASQLTAASGTTVTGNLEFFTNNAGSIANRMVINANGTIRFNNYGAGTLTTDGSGNITASSDERLKDIQGNFSRGLDDILNLDPILYKWNGVSGMETSGVYAGFSAQDVQGAIPEAVSTDSRGFLTLQDRPIIAASVNAIKELNTRVAALEAATGVNPVFATLNVSGHTTLKSLTVETVNITGNLTVGGHIITAGDSPEATVLGANTQVTVDGNDTAGTITITAGQGQAELNELMEIAFDKAFAAGKKPRIQLTPGNGAAVQSGIYVNTSSVTNLKFELWATADLVDGQEYTFNYFIVE